MEQKTSNQEIDLLRLLAKTYGIIKKNIILVIVCPGLGLLLGFVYVKLSTQPKLSKHVGESSFMMATDQLSEPEANFLCSSLSADSISGLNKEQNEAVVGLKYEVKKEASKDKTLVVIKITATITQNYILKPLEDALLKYFNESEPVVRQRRAKDKLYKAMIKKLDDELAALEEMKKDSKDKNLISYTEGADLYEKRLTYANALDASSVYIVKGFNKATPIAASASPKLPYLVLGFLSGIFLLITILFIRFFSAYYKRFEQETA